MLEAEFSQPLRLTYSITSLSSESPLSANHSFFAQQAQSSPLLSSLSAGRSIAGNRLNNRLTGSTTADRIRGGEGDDQIRGLGGSDWLSGEQGNDRLFGGVGNDRLLGGNGKNQLTGEAGNDHLIGGNGNDRLIGGLGADVLIGNGGTDQLTGGANGDRFRLQSGSVQLAKASVITDFTLGEDRLEFGQTSSQQIRVIAGTEQLAGSAIVQNIATGKYLAILRSVRADGLTIAMLQNPSLIPSSSIDPPVSPPVPSVPPAPPVSPPIAPSVSSIQTSSLKFLPTDSEATIAATGATSIQIGTQTIYIGTQQVTSLNQNPIVASFDSSNPANQWVKTNYEMTGADGRGYGLFWSGTDLYAVFSVDGTQGTPEQDFRRVSGSAVQPWLRSYGKGGGPKAAVIARLNLASGEMTEAAYLSAVLSDGKTNSLEITAISQNSAGNLVIRANSWFAPRRPDGKAMTQIVSGSSPFNYTVEMAPDLRSVINTAAIGWT
ncbi:calcium-binding protein [Leptolyngbya sp. GB1-A1]|uniref:calcium-binding protein n=1 Tax=Leptolyngbya sp. GB1-A1 TaxID=2933908 RepID=UPI00329A1B61